MKTQHVSRQQRRAMRLQSLVGDREAHRAAIRAGLDYRTSGESGALVVHTHSLSWHRAKCPNITTPPSGREWDRSGHARVVEGPRVSFTMPVIQDQSGKQVGATNS